MGQYIVLSGMKGRKHADRWEGAGREYKIKDNSEFKTVLVIYLFLAASLTDSLDN